MKKIFIVIGSLVACNGYADQNYIDYQPQKNQSESQTEAEYSGIVGTGVKSNTVSAAGGAVEFSPSGANFYGFFTQTLANGIYYEGRLYTRNNYDAQNPLFPSVPASNENNPWGYGAVVKLGYDFQPNQTIDIIPYLRLNAYNNMSTVYEDTNGDYIHSTSFAIIPGVKLAYKITPQFNPYVDLSAGWQHVNLSGEFPQADSPYAATGTVSQTVMTYEIGFSSKLSTNLALIPYMQYITTTNNPDSTAAAPYSQNGFNISALTGTQQVFGLKLSAGW